MEMKDRISLIIQKRNITRSAFARAIKVSPAAVTQMCSGQTNPSGQTIELICTNYHVREEWLKTGEGEMELVTDEREKLQRFFADVLATAPDERSAFIAALADLPDDFWPVVAALIRAYSKNYGTKKED